MSLLIENFPEAAEVVLNQCVHTSEHLSISDPEYTVTYNFKCIDPDPDVKMPNGRFSAIQTMIKHKRERLLLHPLTLKFNERKWDRLGRYVYMFDYGTYLILMILLTVHTVKVREGEFKPAVLFMLFRHSLYCTTAKNFCKFTCNAGTTLRTRPITWIGFFTSLLHCLHCMCYHITSQGKCLFITSQRKCLLLEPWWRSSFVTRTWCCFSEDTDCSARTFQCMLRWLRRFSK